MPGGVCVTDEGACVITRLCVPLTVPACVATLMFACVYLCSAGLWYPEISGLHP